MVHQPPQASKLLTITEFPDESEELDGGALTILTDGPEKDSALPSPLARKPIVMTRELSPTGKWKGPLKLSASSSPKKGAATGKRRVRSYKISFPGHKGIQLEQELTTSRLKILKDIRINIKRKQGSRRDPKGYDAGPGFSALRTVDNFQSVHRAYFDGLPQDEQGGMRRRRGFVPTSGGGGPGGGTSGAAKMPGPSDNSLNGMADLIWSRYDDKKQEDEVSRGSVNTIGGHRSNIVGRRGGGGPEASRSGGLILPSYSSSRTEAKKISSDTLFPAKEKPPLWY